METNINKNETCTSGNGVVQRCFEFRGDQFVVTLHAGIVVHIVTFVFAVALPHVRALQ